MTTLLSIITIIAIVFSGLWTLADKNYRYLYDNFNKILYLIISFTLIPILWEFIIFILKKISENKIGANCHLKNVEMFNGLTTNNHVFLTLIIVSVSSCFFLIFLLKTFNPNNKN
jgi:hypothetical protein